MLIALFVLGLFGLSIAWMENAYLSPPDSASYFSVARSLVIDRDVNFLNEYGSFAFEPNMFYLTPTGLLSNDWPVGSGMMWMPFVAAAHGLARIAHAAGATSPFFQPDGFSPLYRAAVVSGILFYAFCGLLAAAVSARRWYGARSTIWSLLLLLVGTSFGFYFYYYALMAHITSFLLVSLFCAAWMRGVGSRRTPYEWLLLGLLGGLMVMTRPQNALVFVMLGVEAWSRIAEASRGSRKGLLRDYAIGAAIVALAALVAFAPQMLFWWKLYGNPLQMPKIEEMNWLAPRIDFTLFSTYHGLLSWSPVLLLTIPGLWLIYRKDRIVGSAFALVVLAQVYVNSANEIWWAGGSFGNRRFVDYSFIFVLAFAACCRKWGRSPVFITLTAAACLWNFLLLCAERSQVLSLDHHMPWTPDFLRAVAAVPLHPLAVVRALHGDYAGAPFALRLALAALILLAGLGASTAIARALRKGSFARPAVLLVAFVLLLDAWMALAIARTKPIDLKAPATKAFEAAIRKPEYGETISRRNRLLWNNYYEAGLFYFSQGNVTKASAFYEKACALIPQHPSPYRSLGILYAQMGDLKTARAKLEKALEVCPTYMRAREDLIHLYGAILSEDPENVEVLKRLAQTAAEGRQFDTALEAVRRAVSLAPDDADAKQLQGWIEATAKREAARKEKK